MPDFARVVLFHRRRAGLTRVQLAELAGVGKTVVFDIENGKDTVRLATLRKVLDALNIRLEWSSPLADAFAREEADR